MEGKTGKNRYIFPLSVFFLILIMEALLISFGIGFYFYITGKKNINDIEKYTMGYSRTLAESFAKVSEFCYKKHDFTALRDLFHKKIEADMIDEAFFVLGNGKLVVHSNTKTKKNLKGNIANDEISYNIDMILAPLKKNDSRLSFSNYNIIGREIPFNRKQKELIGKYIYKNINSNGWLFTKAIFQNRKPAGTVNFITSKKRIHDSLSFYIKKAKNNIAMGLFVSFFFSLVISVYVMIRYMKNDNAVTAVTIPEIKTEPEDIVIDFGETGEDEIISPVHDPRHNGIDLEVDEPFDETVIHENEEPENQIPEFDLSLDDADVYPDSEYITVEYLGEIDDEDLETETHTEKRGVLAQVIPIDRINTDLIRDAIPLERKAK